MASRASFFAALRGGLLGPTLDQGEIDGCNAILDACDDWPVDWQAYALATAYHETAHTMKPIHEYGGEAYFNRRYGPGMSEGLFTGKSLSAYFGPDKSDPVGARRIINGTDKAKEIAGYFARFKSALEGTT